MPNPSIRILPRRWLVARLTLGALVGIGCGLLVCLGLQFAPTGLGPASPDEPLNLITGLVLVAGVPFGAIAGAYWVFIADRG